MSKKSASSTPNPQPPIFKWNSPKTVSQETLKIPVPEISSQITHYQYSQYFPGVNELILIIMMNYYIIYIFTTLSVFVFYLFIYFFYINPRWWGTYKMYFPWQPLPWKKKNHIYACFCIWLLEFWGIFYTCNNWNSGVLCYNGNKSSVKMPGSPKLPLYVKIFIDLI